MSAAPLQETVQKPPRIDGHRLSEFIYGTVTAMVAVAAVDAGTETSWLDVAAIIIIGAVAIWLAHAYSILISKRVVSGHRLERHEILETLSGSWPIVIAGLILTLPLFPAAAGLWPLDTALWISSFTGIGILALVGFLAGVITKETWSRRLLLAGLAAGLGTIIVLIEFAVHH